MFVTLGRDSPPFGVKTLITHVGWFFLGQGFYHFHRFRCLWIIQASVVVCAQFSLKFVFVAPKNWNSNLRIFSEDVAWLNCGLIDSWQLKLIWLQSRAVAVVETSHPDPDPKPGRWRLEDGYMELGWHYKQPHLLIPRVQACISIGQMD